jgi:hypothetical protein
VEKWLDLLILAGRIIEIQIQTVLHPIVVLWQTAMQSFWFVFSLSIIVGYLIIGTLGNLINYYKAHNFVHRNMGIEPARDIEFSLFLQTLWQFDRSKGLLGNAKSAKSRFLQFSGEERLYIQNYLEHRIHYLRTNHFLFIAAALFIGLTSAIIVGVIPVSNVVVTGEMVLKTLLFVLAWLIIMEVKYVSLNKQTYLHLAWMQETNRLVPVDLINEDTASAIEKESNPSY